MFSFFFFSLRCDDFISCIEILLLCWWSRGVWYQYSRSKAEFVKYGLCISDGGQEWYSVVKSDRSDVLLSSVLFPWIAQSSSSDFSIVSPSSFKFVLLSSSFSSCCVYGVSFSHSSSNTSSRIRRSKDDEG